MNPILFLSITFSIVDVFQHVIYSKAVRTVDVADEAATEINNMLKRVDSVKNHASEVKLGLYQGTWCIENNGPSFATIPSR